MKNFPGKLVVLLIILFLGCNPCGNYDVEDFKRELPLINRIKDIIVEQSLFGENNFVDLDILKTKINVSEYRTLEKLNLQSITKWNDVILFKFSTGKELNYFQKLGENTDHKACNTYLFYSKNKTQRHEYANYERYIECRTAFKDMGAHWTYLSQSQDCAD